MNSLTMRTEVPFFHQLLDEIEERNQKIDTLRNELEECVEKLNGLVKRHEFLKNSLPSPIKITAPRTVKQAVESKFENLKGLVKDLQVRAGSVFNVYTSIDCSFKKIFNVFADALKRSDNASLEHKPLMKMVRMIQPHTPLKERHEMLKEELSDSLREFEEACCHLLGEQDRQIEDLKRNIQTVQRKVEATSLNLLEMDQYSRGLLDSPFQRKAQELETMASSVSSSFLSRKIRFARDFY